MCVQICTLQSIKGKTMYRTGGTIQSRILRGRPCGKVSLPVLRAPGAERQGCEQGTLGGDFNRKANGNRRKSPHWGSFVSALQALWARECSAVLCAVGHVTVVSRRGQRSSRAKLSWLHIIVPDPNTISRKFGRAKG